MNKLKELIIQFINFCIVGGTCFLIDYLLLAFCHEILGIEVLISSAISFSVSVVANYLLSMRFVFKSKISNRRREFIIFVTLSVIGLALNQLLMYIGVDILKIHYLIFKLLATFIVLIYNYITRKIFIEKSL